MDEKNPENLTSNDNQSYEIAHKCKLEITETLKKYNCGFDVSFLIKSTGFQPLINIVYRKPE